MSAKPHLRDMRILTIDKGPSEGQFSQKLSFLLHPIATDL